MNAASNPAPPRSNSRSSRSGAGAEPAVTTDTSVRQPRCEVDYLIFTRRPEPSRAAPAGLDATRPAVRPPAGPSRTRG